jgi:tetratricopeptide (TPR) repeat protein
MEKLKWDQVLGWNEEQIEELRCAGYRYIVQGQYHLARLFFEALVILQPQSLYDIRTLGAIYLELGHPKRAILHFNRAIKLDSKHEPTLLNHTKALLGAGKKDKGMKVARYLTKSGDTAIASQAEALLLAFSM